ncbi:hypothetical protein GCM10010254_40730 [Streptomyces chromofuscus]|nr:hypothetical protein GCM10010254_40730 [Streptomyces chromofuscus]
MPPTRSTLGSAARRPVCSARAGSADVSASTAARTPDSTTAAAPERRRESLMVPPIVGPRFDAAVGGDRFYIDRRALSQHPEWI